MSDTKNQIKNKLDRDEIKSEVIRVIDSKELQNKIAKLVAQELKKSPELEDKVLEITKNVLIQLYKTLWTKRDFWKSQLSNKSN